MNFEVNDATMVPVCPKQEFEKGGGTGRARLADDDLDFCQGSHSSMKFAAGKFRLASIAFR